MTNSGPSMAALKRFEEDFGKSFGPKVLRRGTNAPRYEVISTGSLELDYAMGSGGYVRGRLVETWGLEQTGKTTLSLIGAAMAQRTHPKSVCGFIDMEQTLDLDWAKAHGVDMSRLYVAQPDNAEDVADILKAMMDSELMSYIVLDSIGNMIPREEIEKDAGEATVGGTAKIITRMVKTASVTARRHGTVINIINQVRAGIGKYVADTTRGGGFALGHVTTHRLKTRRSGDRFTIGSKEAQTFVEVGHKLAVDVEKNKVAPPGRVAMISLFNQATEKYGPLGIDRAPEATLLGVRTGVISQKGAFYTLPGGLRFQGKDAVTEHLRAHPDTVEELRKAIVATREHELVDDELDEG